MRGYVAGAIVGFVLGILGSLLASYIEHDWLGGNFTPFAITIIILLTVLGIIIGAKIESERAGVPQDPPSRKSSPWYWVLTGGVVLLIAVLGIIAIVSGAFGSKPLTVYYVIDATEKMAPIFDSVKAQVQVAASGLNGDTRVGLRVFGGQNADPLDCQNSRQLVPPTSFDEGAMLMTTSLDGIIPQGHSSITGALLQTLLFDVENESGRTVRVILFTTGIDPLCDPQSGDLVTPVINKAKAQLIIISIGEQNKNDIRVFSSYADAFNGKFLSVASAADLAPLVTGLSFYGYGYYPADLSAATATP